MLEASENFRYETEEQLYCELDEIISTRLTLSESAFNELAPQLRNLAERHAERLAFKAFADVVSCLPDNSAFILCLKKNLNIDTRSFSEQSAELNFSKQAVGNKKESVERLLDLIHRSVVGLSLPSFKKQIENDSENEQLTLFDN